MQDIQVKYKAFSVQADLRQLVKYIWTMEAKPNAGDYFVFRTFASLNPTLLFVEKGNVEAISEQTTGNLLGRRLGLFVADAIDGTGVVIGDQQRAVFLKRHTNL